MLRIVAKQVLQRRHGLASERQVFVKPLSGSTIVISLSGSDTITKFKQNIDHQTKIPWDKHHLMIDGRRLDDNGTVDDNNVQEECVIKIFGRLVRGS